MNKILNINLGGYALTIDDDAYEYLEAYLQSIRRRFSESEGRDEIVHDIESRLGELVTEGLRGKTIVMLPDVQAAIQVMGKPEDFGADPIDNRRTMGGSGKTGPIRTGKRLFRDEEDAVVGGVCSGLSAYFGMNDPVWMRLIFVLLAFLSFGFWLPAYILLWILVPPAKNAADRLSMRGEPINVDNIAREVEVGFDRLSHKVNEFGSEAKKKSNSGGRSFGNALSGGVSLVGQAFGIFLRFLAKFGLLIAILIAVCLFIALLVSWVAGIISAVKIAPYLSYFSPFSEGTSWFFMSNMFFLFGIPLLGLCLLAVRALFKWRTPRWLGLTLGVGWAASLVSFIFLLIFGFKNYRQDGNISKTIDLSGISSDTLRVERLGEDIDYRFEEDFWGWRIEGDGGPISSEKISVPADLQIRVRKSSSGQFRVVQTVNARGYSNSEAIGNAEQIDYQAVLNGNTLQVPTHFQLVKGQRWRNQRVRIYIEMPPGKFVTFDEKIYGHAAADMDDYDDDNDRNYISRTPNAVFKMTSSGLACTSCPRWGDRDYRDDRNFENFILEGSFTTELRKGDDFSIEIEGTPADKGLLKSIRTGNKLTLTTEAQPLAGKVNVIITTPTFTSLYTKNSGNVTIRGFEEHRASISGRGDTKILGYFDCSNLEISLSEKCSVELTGRGERLEVSLSEGSVFEGGGFKVNHVEASASDGSKARVNADETAKSKSDASSTIRVEGNPSVIKDDNRD